MNMKKVLCFLVAGVLCTSCGMNKNYTSWKNLYEPVASSDDQVPVVENKETEQNVEEKKKPVSEKKVVIRQEEVKRTHGSELRSYSIIAGSFEQEQNAVNLLKTLNELGYLKGSIMQNTQGMNRVAIAGYDNEQQAREALLNFRQEHTEYADAWLLIKK